MYDLLYFSLFLAGQFAQLFFVDAVTEVVFSITLPLDALHSLRDVGHQRYVCIFE